MSFTFSSNEATDYPALGMCDTCGKRFTQGCEHSNTLEAQQWLAAYAATEQNRDNVEYFLETQKDNQPAAVTAYEAEFLDGFSDERLKPENEMCIIDPRTEAQKDADADWEDEQDTIRSIYKDLGVW